jgi:peptidoglycan/xylan/chitin deacetylase (PgdA/CDA1 family)
VQKGTLIISLDFELHWGRFDKYSPEDYLTYYRNTRKVIPRILELFDKYQIHATWATVGMLMAENWEEWESFSPKVLPVFQRQTLSAYHWKDRLRAVDKDAFFAPELVKLILDAPNQELGSHTFAHYYTGVQGSTQEGFLADLEAAQNISKSKFDHKLQSLVFPRNQYNQASIETAAKAGFEFVRTNPGDWFWKNTADESLVKKVFRTGDTLFPMGERTSFEKPAISGSGIISIPASRLLRPYKRNSIFNQVRINRIKKELGEASKNSEMYHLWWHPHNFGHHPEENLKILESILMWVGELRERSGFNSLNMKDAGTDLVEYIKLNKIKKGSE